MYKFRLISIGLFVSVCLNIPYAFSNLPSANTTTELSKLSPLVFKDRVKALNADTQNKLDATIAQLVGGAPPAIPAPVMPVPAAHENISQTSPEAETPAPPEDNATTTNTPTSSGPGLNPYNY